MNELKNLILNKIKLCLNSISNLSSNEMDRNESEAVEHLTRAYFYLCQIKESED